MRRNEEKGKNETNESKWKNRQKDKRDGKTIQQISFDH